MAVLTRDAVWNIISTLASGAKTVTVGDRSYTNHDLTDLYRLLELATIEEQRGTVKRKSVLRVGLRGA